MNLLLLGKSGQLGSDLWKAASKNHEVVAYGREDLDLEKISELEGRILPLRPDVILNAAAYVDVARSEQEYERAFRVNCLAVNELARISRALNARFTTFSTDYVFDGKSKTPYAEDAPTSPLQMYGLSKEAGEKCALLTWPDKTQIIRTCGLYGARGSRAKGGNFVDNRIRDGLAGRSLTISHDQVVSPSSTKSVAEATIRLLEHPKAEAGVYHFVNEGQCSWYELTRAIYHLLGIGSELRPVDQGGAFAGVRRPMYSVLGNQRGAALGIRLPHWKDALKEYLATREKT